MKRNGLKTFIQQNPLFGPLAEFVYKTIAPFRGSKDYWVNRYKEGGNSGDGSYGQLATFKAKILNEFVAGHQISTVIEYGCGDGNQLTQAQYPAYTGFDISALAIDMCKKLFVRDHTKQFKMIKDYQDERADLTLSLDVIYHLVEDPIFNDYMERLFDSSDRYVIIYSSNTDENPKLRPPHVRHRKFSNWIESNRPDWQLFRHIVNEYPPTHNASGESFADFYIYKK